MKSTWEEILGTGGSKCWQQGLNGTPRLLRDLELDRSPRLLLDDGCSGPHISSRTNIVYSQLDQVASTKLAINRQIKDRKVSP